MALAEGAARGTVTRRIRPDELTTLRQYLDNNVPGGHFSNPQKSPEALLEHSGKHSERLYVSTGAYFEIGICTGFRAAELTSIRWYQVWDFARGAPQTELRIERVNLKGGKAHRASARVTALSDQAQLSIHRLWLCWRAVYPWFADPAPNHFVFVASHRPGYATKDAEAVPDPGDTLLACLPLRITTEAMRQRLKRLYMGALADDRNLSHHSMRKHFCTAVYALCDKDIIKTARITGHRNPVSLQHYIATSNEEVDRVWDRLRQM
jgi:integrase